jgi:PhnB protein
MAESYKPFFAPQLFIPSGVRNIEFYTKAFGAIELQRWSNDDGTVHVAELSIEGTIFHLHEETPRISAFSPTKHNSITTIIGLFVSDVHAVMKRAIAAGAIEISATQDYDYGYRQGQVKDPFGHIWMIEKKVLQKQ